MSSQAIGQRFGVSRGGCWQCVPDCRIRVAEVLTLFQMAYNGQSYAARVEDVRGRVPHSGGSAPCFFWAFQALGQ